MMRNRRMFLLMVRKALLGERARLAIAMGSVALVAALIAALLAVSLDTGSKLGGQFRSFGANIILEPAGTEKTMDGSLLEKLSVGDQAKELHGYAPLLSGNVVVGRKLIRLVGTDFAAARRISPWWKVNGRYPGRNSRAVLVGSDLTGTLRVGKGDTVQIDPAARLPSNATECKSCHGTVPQDHEQRLQGKVARVGVDCLTCHQAHPIGGGTPIRLTVSGILSTGGGEDEQIVAPLALAQALLDERGRISQVQVSALTNRRSVDQTARVLQRRINGVRASPIARIARPEESLLGKVQLLLALVAIVVLSTASLSLASTTTAAVLERREQIGLLKALGATHVGIGSLFLAEAAVTGVFGGFIGLALGYLIAQAIGLSVFGASIAMPPLVPVITLLMTVTLATLSSLTSIRRAVRIDPATSLRGE